MGAAASTKKYKSSNNEPQPFPTPTEQHIIKTSNSESDLIDTQNRNNKERDRTFASASIESMKLNSSQDEIIQALNRVRNEAAIGGGGGLLYQDAIVPTPPDSPAPTPTGRRRNRSGSSMGGAADFQTRILQERGSPQADFVLDEDSSANFDDESPAMQAIDITGFMSLQRQKTVSMMKNSELEREVAELEKQLKEMDRIDMGSGGKGKLVPSEDRTRLPRVDSKSGGLTAGTVVGARRILSSERPNSGAAVMPDPTATTAHRDDSYTPSGTSSRQSSRGLVKAALRNASSASALEAASSDHLRQYNNCSRGSNAAPVASQGERGGTQQELSPPPSPPPLDPGEDGDTEEMYKTKVIYISDVEDNDGGPGPMRKSEKWESNKSQENLRQEAKSDRPAKSITKPALKFEQPPHNSHHHRHIKHRRNSSGNDLDEKKSQQLKDIAQNNPITTPPPSKADLSADPAVSHSRLALLNKKKDKDKDRNTVVVVSRRRRTVGENGQFGEEKAMLPNAEMKRLLVPVAPSAASSVTATGQTSQPGVIRGLPRAAASLSPLLPVNTSEDGAIPERNRSGDESPVKDLPHIAANPTSSSHLAPLANAPPIKHADMEDSTGRIPALPVHLVKEKGRSNAVLQGVNRRRPRLLTDEETGSTSSNNPAAMAYMQAISPRDDHQQDAMADRGFPAASVDSVMLSGKLTSRINGGATGGAITATDHHTAETAAHISEPHAPKSSTLQQQAAARRRRDRSSTSDNINGTAATNNGGTDSETAEEKNRGEKKRPVVASKRVKRKTLGNRDGTSEDEAGPKNSPSKITDVNDTEESNKAGGAISWSIDIKSGNKAAKDEINAQIRPWSQTMELRLLDKLSFCTNLVNMFQLLLNHTCNYTDWGKSNSC